MDPDDPADVRRWLRVHNAAFRRDWDEGNHRLAMVENPVVLVERTYLAERDGEAVGTASTGRFRGNIEIGVGHYLAVHPDAQGLGLATALCSLRYRALVGELEVAEAQTHGHRIGSLRAHFACGFGPKVGPDPWNSLEPVDGPLRDEADRRLVAAFEAWRADAAG
jgi:GNAT superfamily N-acetyltransferase